MHDLPKAFSPKEIEEKLLHFWEEGKFFQANASSSKPTFSISIPPPNVTGVLHMGHALVNTLQDVIVRWKRMSGYETLWVPGTDHAGIATQTIVERHLFSTQKRHRSDFSREEFLEEVWAWKEQSEQRILSQLRRLGSSCDTSRLAFTMDPERSRAVRSVFKKMFDDGLIYRGHRLIHWDPVTQTALADDEVEYEERPGFLWYLRYPFADGKGYAIIATTRPETMLGDVAIAVSPSDQRFQEIIGKEVILPIVDRRIPIIADSRIDPTFGSGMVKITPAHDFNDYEIGRDHNLPSINVMTPDGRIAENGGPYAGMTIDEARVAIVEKIRSLGLLQKEESHVSRVGISYRSKATLQPYLSEQWFVNMSPFKEPLISAVRDKRVELIPSHWEATYMHWIENLRDWCISRQLWWGHQIPIWYRRDDRSRIICYAGEGLPPEVAQEPGAWEQDHDVLDTWFSSALWPFSTLGWPDKTPDLEKFYPNSLLITGHDILFFWVARMILMGEYATGTAPFPKAFLHGLIYGRTYWRPRHDGGAEYITGEEKQGYDLGKPIAPGVHAKWEKMSKTKGNVIDPLDMIDAYGADALRVALCASATQARQIDLDRRRFEEFKNFANKVWNGARFVMMNLATLSPQELGQGLDLAALRLEDRWILATLAETVETVSQALESYHFDRAAMNTYQFFWDQFCAYYVEMTKPVLFDKMGTPEEKASKQKVLFLVLFASIRLMHPMAPFITEHLFQLLQQALGGATAAPSADPYTREALTALAAPACCVAPFPQALTPPQWDQEQADLFAATRSLIHTIRNVRGTMQIPPALPTDLYLAPRTGWLTGSSRQSCEAILRSLLPLQQIFWDTPPPADLFCAQAQTEDIALQVPVARELAEKELARLVKEEEKLAGQINSLTAKLANAEFVARAPAEFVARQQELLAEAESQLRLVLERLQELRASLHL